MFKKINFSNFHFFQYVCMEGAYITLYAEFQEYLTHNDGIISFYFCAIFGQKHCTRNICCHKMLLTTMTAVITNMQFTINYTIIKIYLYHFNLMYLTYTDFFLRNYFRIIHYNLRSRCTQQKLYCT